MLNWIFFDDHVRRKSMHKIEASGSDWANEPEAVAGFPSSQLKALRCNCEMLLQYTDVRRAMRSGTMGPVLVCERGINSYACEERFSRVAGIMPAFHFEHVSFGKVIFGLTLYLSVSGVCDRSLCVRHAES